jgi:TetR/AcrR family transcriptional regulator, mexJK operon transcriptional repressor
MKSKMKKTQVKKHDNKVASSRKSLILREAADLFLELGYKDASINELVRRVGGSKETVYRHFKNKEALFTAVLDEELGYKVEVYNTLDIDHLDVHEALSCISTATMRSVTTERAMAIRRLVFNESARRPEIGKLWYDHGAEIGRAFLEQYFRKLQKKGKFKQHKASVLSEYFLAMLMHRTMLKCECSVIKKPGKKQLDTLIKRIVADFIDVFGG